MRDVEQGWGGPKRRGGRRPAVWLLVAASVVLIVVAIVVLALWLPGPQTGPRPLRGQAAQEPDPATLFRGPASFLHGPQTGAPETGWTAYGGDPEGTRYSAAQAISRGNVDRLAVRWVAHTHALDGHRPWQKKAAFEATPVLFNDTLYLSTPFDQVLALDPATGAERWRFDPQAVLRADDPGVVTSRGVGVWHGRADRGACAARVFIGTLDARLIAIDAATGRPCADFGSGGTVDLRAGVGGTAQDEFGVTSAPAVVGDVVVTGTLIGDNHRADMPRGVVRGFDVRTGRERWCWNPLPWAENGSPRTGGANTWSTIAADPEHGILYLPTSSPSPDFYGAQRPGNNADADSVVALDAKTGRKLWAFQVVHHNLWDYDVAAEPLVFDLDRDGAKVPAVAVATKMGTVFVLNRLTGQPLFPVEEQPVPPSDVRGERASPTQPRSWLPPLVPNRLTPDEAWGPTDADRQFCRDKLSLLRNDGEFTPPSVRGSLLYPGSLGGVNWGSMAFDPASQTLYANTNRQPFLVRLGAQDETWWHDNISLPLSSWLNTVRRPAIRDSRAFRWLLRRFYADEGFQTDPEKKAENPHFGKEYSTMPGTPWVLIREPLVSPSGLPCSPPPWGLTAGLNLRSGTVAWQQPLGGMDSQPQHGSLALGGPIVTAGGLLFTAGGRDAHLRALDSATGRLLWTGQLPAPAQATPMTYTWRGTQYVVIAAGGHGGFGTEQGDSVVAFALRP